MSLNRLWMIGVALLILSAPLCAQTVTLPDPRSVFTLELPNGCTVVRREGLPPDFEVYDVLCHSAPYAGIYVGNFPDRKIEGRILETHRPQWPELIQIWSDQVPNDQEQANRIAASVRATKP